MKEEAKRRLSSFALQATFIVMAASTLIIPLFSGEMSNLFFAILFFLPLGIVQLGDALIGAIMGVRWRKIYFFSAVTYLFLITVISELPLRTYDVDEAFRFISILILPTIMGLSYCYLTYKEI